MTSISENTKKVKSIAKELGFTGVGIAKARRLEQEAKHLEEWLLRGYQGQMSYMANHFEKRIDPSKLVPGAKTVICLAYNYYTDKIQDDPQSPRISIYAYGEDYHTVIRQKLKILIERIRTEIGTVAGRGFVDSAPILERDWAKYAGLGWTGKNTLLINPRKGSFFFLAELILDLELEPDVPIRDYCGTCTRCIDACPTEAISPKGYIVDGSKCISYLTIELKEAIPEEFSGKLQNWMFGCDICQKVCPWNRFSSPHHEPAFDPSDQMMQMTKNDWIEMTEDIFQEIFKKSAVKRTKYQGLKRNINFLRKGSE